MIGVTAIGVFFAQVLPVWRARACAPGFWFASAVAGATL